MRLRVLVATLLLLGACSIERDVDASGDGVMGARVDSLFMAQIRSDGPGCAVGVYRDGVLELTRGYGVTSVEDQRPITPRTVFNLGSVAKQFTALAVLQLEQQGKLLLTDDVRRFIPEMLPYPDPIRINDLLAHTSGLRDYQILPVFTGRPVTTMADFLDLVARQRTLNFTPGTRHEYSHSDYELLGIIVERASGEPFGRYLENQVLSPLGMTSSRVHDMRRVVMPERAYSHVKVGDEIQQRFPYDEVIGGGNLYTSVEDLYKWDLALADGAAGRHPLIARMLVRPTLPNGDTIPYAWGIRRGKHRGLPILSRAGDSYGTRAELVRFPDQNFAVSVLCNGSHLSPGLLGDRVIDLYLEDQMAPRRPPFAAPPPEVEPAPGEVEQFAGYYGDLERIDRFTVVNGKFTELLGDTVQTWTYRGNGLFTGDGSTDDFRVTFATPDSGGPMRYVITWRDEVRYTGNRLPDSAVWQPAVTDLAPYAGTWVNDELDLVWRLVVQSGTLKVERYGAPDASLLPHRRDRFSTRFGPWDNQLDVDVEFVRNRRGQITGFEARTSGEPAIRDVQFVRVPSP